LYKCIRDGRIYTTTTREEPDVANEELLNPNFTVPFTVRHNAHEVEVANGWEPWWADGRDLKRPEFKPENRNVGRGRVYIGDTAQKLFTTYSKHDAGIWQRVNAIPDQWYLFTAHVGIWTSEEDDPTVNDGTYHAMLGVNPWGHWPLHHASIWGKEADWQLFSDYQQISVLFQAWHNEISLIVRGLPRDAVKHNDLYIDAAKLEPITVYINEEPPPPTTEPPTEPPAVGEVDYARITREVSKSVITQMKQLTYDIAVSTMLTTED
jgi:hypothetical protein